MSKRSQQEWIDEALLVLGEGGIEAVRVEPLAKRLAVSKGSFYWHFDNRRALHLAMLSRWEELGTSSVIEAVESHSNDPVKRLRGIVGFAFQADDRGDGIEVAIRAWAKNDDTAASAARRVDDRRINYVVGLLLEAGLPRALAKRRSLLLYRSLVGAATWRLAGGPVASKRELDELTELLLLSPS